LDRVSEIVDRAISIANIVKMKKPERFATALEALSKIAAELRSRWPNHPSLKKLEIYLSKEIS